MCIWLINISMLSHCMIKLPFSRACHNSKLCPQIYIQSLYTTITLSRACVTNKRLQMTKWHSNQITPHESSPNRKRTSSPKGKSLVLNNPACEGEGGVLQHAHTGYEQVNTTLLWLKTQSLSLCIFSLNNKMPSSYSQTEGGECKNGCFNYFMIWSKLWLLYTRFKYL